mgnify:CR=1 FL=1
MGLFTEGFGMLKLVDKGANAALYRQLGEWIERVHELERNVELLQEENQQIKEQSNSCDSRALSTVLRDMFTLRETMRRSVPVVPTWIIFWYI